MKKTMDLLEAEKFDKMGDCFSLQCLQKVAEETKTGLAAIPVRKSFKKEDEGLPGIIGYVDRLYVEGNVLKAEVEFFDSPEGEAAQKLVSIDGLELAFGGKLDNKNVVPTLNPSAPLVPARIIEEVQMTDAALTNTKVK